MTNFSRGEVILVPFPFSDQTAVKQRPALIISSDVYNQKSNDIIIMAITTRLFKGSENIEIGEFLIENWSDAGLLKPSSIKPVVATLEKSLIIKKLGSLSKTDLTKFEVVLKNILSLN